MVNCTKTRLMTKCSVYEKNGGDEDIDISGFYKADYIRLTIAKGILFSTIGFLCLFGLYFVYNINYFLEMAFTIDYRNMLYKLASIYLLIILVTICVNCVWSSIKYNYAKSRLSKYYKTLTQINMMNEQDEKIKDLEE